MQVPEKGDIVYMQFSPQSGHEQAGHRPGLVLSPLSFNKATKFAVVCPITKQVKGYPFEVELPEGLEVEGVVLTDQEKSMDWQSRDLKIVDKAPEETIKECIEKIQTYLYDE